MKIDKESEYCLKDDNGNEIRIKYKDDKWLIVVNDYCVFYFDVDDARKLSNLFDEIHRSSHVFLKVLKDIDKAISDSVNEG